MRLYTGHKLTATVTNGLRTRVVAAYEYRGDTPVNGWDVNVLPVEKVGTLDGQGPPHRHEYQVHDWFGYAPTALAAGVEQAVKEIEA